MYAITDADREAAEELRVLLADVSGFWHTRGDAGPICIALARHRHLSELRLWKQLQNVTRPASVIPLKPAGRESSSIEVERRPRDSRVAGAR